MTPPRLLPAALLALALLCGCGSPKPDVSKVGPKDPGEAPAAKGFATPEDAWKAAAEGFAKNDFERGISAFTRGQQFERIAEQVGGVPHLDRWVMDALTKNAGEGAFKGKAGPKDKGGEPVGEKERAALAPYLAILADHGVTEKAIAELGSKAGGPRTTEEVLAALVKDPAACFVAVSKKIYENEKPSRDSGAVASKLEDVRIDGDKATGRASAGGPPERLLFEKSPSGGWLISGNEPPANNDKGGPADKGKGGK